MWHKLSQWRKRLKWHHVMRLIAGALLVDQMLGTVTAIPTDTTVVLAAIGALCAPVPTERHS